MTVASTTNRVSYTGNGNVDTYSYTFRIFSESDLLVTVKDTDDNETELDLTTDYTVSGVGDAGGGSIALVNSSQDWLDAGGDLLTGFILVIRRVRPLTQETDIRGQGSFYPEIHEDALDHLVMVAQQLQDEVDRCVKLPETVSGSVFNTLLPSDGLAANTVLLVNSTGDGFETGPTADQVSGAQASAAAASASASAASASASSASSSASSATASASSATASAIAAAASAAAATPMTTLGDMIYENATPVPARLAGNTTTTKNFLTQTGNGSISAPPVWSSHTAPLTTIKTSGSGTHTLTGSPLYLIIEVTGGGGGGGGSGTSNGTAATAGTASSVSTAGGAALVTAGGGGAGGSYSTQLGGAGGTVTIAAGPIAIENIAGNAGGAGSFTSLANVFAAGGMGGSTGLGGLGAGTGGAANHAAANSGAGGNGAGNGGGAVNSASGSGGGSGARIIVRINSPAAAYDFSVGAGGTKAAAGGSGAAGGDAGSGRIVFTEVYQ